MTSHFTQDTCVSINSILFLPAWIVSDKKCVLFLWSLLRVFLYHWFSTIWFGCVLAYVCVLFCFLCLSSWGSSSYLGLCIYLSSNLENVQPLFCQICFLSKSFSIYFLLFCMYVKPLCIVPLVTEELFIFIVF